MLLRSNLQMRVLVAEIKTLAFVPGRAVFCYDAGCNHSASADQVGVVCVRSPYYVPPEVNWFPDEAAGFTYERATGERVFVFSRP